MRFIAHRGNIYGPDPSLENSPSYIDKALSLGFDVEIDVWVIQFQIYLGHDEPQYKTNLKFLLQKNLWCHAKNLDALEMLLENNVHCFVHDTDMATLTSKNFVWTFPGEYHIKNSVCVMPERNSVVRGEFLGVCSDYVYWWRLVYLI